MIVLNKTVLYYCYERSILFMVLLRQKAKREGFEDYTDFYMCWSYKGKKYAVRVRPVFACDLDKFVGASTFVEDNEPLEKYID